MKLHDDNLIVGWAFLVALEVRHYASKNMNSEHIDAIQRGLHRLYNISCPNKDPKIVGKDIEEDVDLFWDEFKCVEKMTKPFDNVSRKCSSC